MEHQLERESPLKQAALNQHNIIVVCGMALFALAVASPIPLLVALAGEIVWLAVGSRTPRFRRWAAARAVPGEQRRWRAEVDRAAARLDAPLGARLRTLEATLEDVARLIDQQPPGDELGAAKGRLEEVLRAYASLLEAEDSLLRMIGAGRTGSIEEEIARVGKALGEERDATVRMSLRQALALSQRRLKQVAEVESARRALQVKVSLLETSLDYVRAQLRVGPAPGAVTAALDEMLAAAQFNPNITAEAARSLSHARMTAINHPVISATGH
jgi:hypothetical protein